VLNLWIAPIDDMSMARPVTAVTDRNLGPSIVWMHNDQHVVFFRQQGGDENWRIWRVDLHPDDIRPLSPGSGVKSFVQQVSRHFSSELLIAHNERDKRYFDIYRVDVATGESTLLQANDGFAGYFTDQRLRVRFATGMAENGDVERLRRDESAAPTAVAELVGVCDGADFNQLVRKCQTRNAYEGAETHIVRPADADERQFWCISHQRASRAGRLEPNRVPERFIWLVPLLGESSEKPEV